MYRINNDIITKFPKSNPYEKPKVEKIIVDITLSTKNSDKFGPIPLIHTLTYFTGQFPQIKKAKKSLASYKIRKGMEIGVKNTLRKHKLKNFIKLLSHVSLPHLAATIPGQEAIKKSKLNYSPSYKTPNLSLGIKKFSSLGAPYLTQQLHSPLKTYSGGANIQFIFNTKSNVEQNMFILSCLLIPLCK